MTIKRTNTGMQSIEVLDRVLDKGIVIDAEDRYSALGINLFDIDAHGVVASFDTYLTYAGPIWRCRLGPLPCTHGTSNYRFDHGDKASASVAAQGGR
jgi:Gas vesicle protein